MTTEILVFLNRDGGPHKLARALPALPAGSDVEILACTPSERMEGTTKPRGLMQRLRHHLFGIPEDSQ